MKKTNNHKEKIIEYITRVVMKGELSEDSQVQIIELIGNEFLRLKSIQKCANDNGKSYNGIKKTRKVRTIFGVKLVVDNE